MRSKEFIDIYVPLGEAMYRAAFYMLESKPDAEDAVQDLYIRLWNSRSSLHSVKNPKAYCMTLIKNICIDRIRRATGSPERIGLHENLQSGAEADDGAVGRETAMRIAAAIRKLPERQRKVLQLKIFGELSNDGISKETGMSNLTVRVLLSQARKTLKKALDNENR